MAAHTDILKHGSRKLLVLLGLVAWLSLFSQNEQWQSLGVDEIFQLARPKAFNNQRPKARVMLRYILVKSPDYHDVRILLGRTHAWDGNYDSARLELQRVLSSSPSYQDALSALLDTELWSEHYADALQQAERSLKIYPNNRDFMFKKATALYNLKQENEALLLLQQVLSLDPGYQPAARLQNTIKTNKLKYTVGIGYSLDAFSRTFNPAHYASTQLARINSWGTSIFRVNYANRFSDSGIQPEIDLYPRIVNGMYAYLNYGFSTNNLFPKHRVGAELYKSLPKGLEISGGLRYLYFGDTSKVYIFTGSFGWYFKNYWLSLRPFITPDKRSGTSFSTSLDLRHYFSDSNNYLGFSGGFGFTPDEKRFQSTGGLSTDGIYVLKNQRAGVTWQKTLPSNFMINISLNLTHQELSFDVGNYLWITGGSFWIRKRF